MDVTITFLTFDLENDPLPGGDGDCKYDWLEVWDGLPGGEQLRSANRRAASRQKQTKKCRCSLCPAYVVIDPDGVKQLFW